MVYFQVPAQPRGRGRGARGGGAARGRGRGIFKGTFYQQTNPAVGRQAAVLQQPKMQTQQIGKKKTRGYANGQATVHGVRKKRLQNTFVT